MFKKIAQIIKRRFEEYDSNDEIRLKRLPLDNEGGLSFPQMLDSIKSGANDTPSNDSGWLVLSYYVTSMLIMKDHFTINQF